MSDLEHCRVCGQERPADAPLGLCPACMLKAGLAGESSGQPAAAADEKTAAYVPNAEHPGILVAGRYKLLEKIGEGGMGEVWVADQTEPIKRRVALKLIKPGMDSKNVLGRFEAERQALAVMDHPHIARVLDAGATADGRPYFVMELVKGTPITEFCDARRLTPKQRLELFIPVCQAIQHAHMKGIIHRDIKPSNVLVALHDEVPVAKVIDFGVAKAVGQQLTEKTIYTGFGALVGTPAYMAPEQATFNQLDVDTRADVYALGVLLYELLAGSPPIEKERLKQAALDEVLRIVRDEEPPRPSQRLSTSQAKASIAATRQSDPARLSALMQGEIDWIVMKALEKDRTRRYDTANGLAKDIQRYLAGDAVEACPPTLAYRLQKAYRRNRMAVRVASAFVMLLIAAVAVSSWMAVMAEQAKAVADANALRASGNAGAAMEALQESELLRIATELSLAGRQVDIDLFETPTDSQVALLRLVRTLQSIPDHRKGIQIKLSSGVEVIGTDKLHPELHPVTVTGFGIDAPDDLLAGERALREFVTAALLIIGQNHAPLFPPITHDGYEVFSRWLSPDGKTLVTIGADGTARLWESPTTRPIAVLRQDAERVVQCGFSPDGRTIFTSDYDSALRFWNASDGAFRAKTDIPESRYVYPKDLSLMQAIWAAPQANGVWMTENRVLTQSHPVMLDSSLVNVEHLYFASPCLSAELWDTATGRSIARFDRPENKGENCRFANDGKWITTVEDKTRVMIYSAENGREIGRLIPDKGEGAKSAEIKFAVSPSGRRILTNSRIEGSDNLCQRRIWEPDPWHIVPDAFLDNWNNDWNNNDWVDFLNDTTVSIHSSGDSSRNETILYQIGRLDSNTSIGVQSAKRKCNGDLILLSNDRILDGKTLKRLVPPDGQKYHPSLARIARDGRFVFATGCIIDTVTQKSVALSDFDTWLFPGDQPAFFENFGSVAVGYADSQTRLLPVAECLDISPPLLQLWAQVVVRGELGPEGEFVKWDEPTWEKKRQELEAIPPPYPDLPFPGYVATDKLHWLRAEYEAAAKKDKPDLATRLLSRAETAGDKIEAVRWRAILDAIGNSSPESP